MSNKINEMMDARNQYIFYKDRSDWKDIKPIYQDDGDRVVVQIAYSEKFADAHNYLRAVMAKDEKSQRAFDLTTDVVLLNAANFTVWEYRRRLLKHLSLDLAKEMRFLGNIIEEHSKNYQVWHHREWLAMELDRYIIEKVKDDGEEEMSKAHNLQGLEELGFVEKILSDDAKNYHAWQHRRWAYHYFGIKPAVELGFTEEFIEEDVYCNSAWNHRFYVVQHEGLSSEVLNREIAFAQSCIRRAPGNESSWNYLYGLVIPLPAVVAASTPDNLSTTAVVQQLRPPARLLVKMRKFYSELLAADASVNDSQAALSFLFEVLVDCISLRLNPAEHDNKQSDQSPAKDGGGGGGATFDESEESLASLASELIGLSERLETEVDRVRATYWRYRRRQVDLLLSNSASISAAV